jgi:hypothetical protein
MRSLPDFNFFAATQQPRSMQLPVPKISAFRRIKFLTTLINNLRKVKTFTKIM